eukprot:6340147-Pyramimonas_sp.AAC.1
MESSRTIGENSHMDSTTSEIMALIWAILYIIMLNDKMETDWTVTSDSKIALGIVHGKHGYQPNWELAVFLDALSRDVCYRGNVSLQYTKSHDLDPRYHLADNIARSNLVVHRGVPHLQVAEHVEYDHGLRWQWLRYDQRYAHC